MAPTITNILLCGFIGVKLNRARDILQHHKRPALGHNTTGDTGLVAQSFQLFFALLAKLFLQFIGKIFTTKFIGKSLAFFTNGGQFATALGNQLVFIDGLGRFFTHGNIPGSGSTC